MKQLAAQLYTVREFTQTAKDFAKTCQKIRKMGYEGVQLSAVGPIPPQEIQKILEGEGLACVTTHTRLERIEQEPQAVIDEHLLWNCPHVAIGGFFPGEKEERKAKTWKDFSVRFSKIAKTLSKAGLTLGYHNHFHEFIQTSDGLTGYEHLIRELDPANTWFEIDTYWVAAAAKSPATLLRRLAHRVPCIHLKDAKIVRKKEGFGPEYHIAEVGDGNLDWPEILDAAQFAGVQWYIVERDNGELDPFRSLERSFHNLRFTMGL
ncbi:MAG: sugar phosphate isomerase/epimerase family protein [Oligosphaeraceae bacterium]